MHRRRFLRALAAAAGAGIMPRISVAADDDLYDIGRFGNCGVGILEGPGTVSFSMSAGKTFFVTERVGIRYEAQFANLFNFLNRAIPNMNVGSSSFGEITQSQGIDQGGPRSIQMQLRLLF